MRKKDRYKIIDFAVNQYRDIFKVTPVPVKLTNKRLTELLEGHGNYSICEWYFCCYGWQKNCWQDFYKEGQWGLTRDDVKKMIIKAAKNCAKDRCGEHRTYMCYTEKYTGVYLIMRDTDHQCDYLIAFQNKDAEEKSA